MIWLVTQLWPWLLLAAGLGAAVTALAVLTRVPVPAPAAGNGDEPRAVEPWDEAPPAEGPADEPTAALRPMASPFPVLAGHAPDDRPWEAEELWSRPARLAAGTHRATTADEWSDAAQNWRGWAQEATGAERAPELPRPEDPFPYAGPVEAPGHADAGHLVAAYEPRP